MRLVLSLILAAALAGCAAIDWPNRPSPVAGQADTYRFKFYLGDLKGSEPADVSVIKDLESFKTTNGYARYAVISRLETAVPYTYDYLVRFGR